MILIVKYDTSTGRKILQSLTPEEFSGITMLLKKKSAVEEPQEGQLYYDDDYLYLFVNGREKKIPLLN